MIPGKPIARGLRRGSLAPLASGARLLPFLLLPLLPAPPAAAQSDARLKTIAEQQGMLRRRVEGLRQKMEGLGRRLESEGRTHAAELLRRGVERLARETGPAGESKTIDVRMAEIADSLSRELPGQVLDDQQRVVSDLEELLTILLDRQDLERLEKALAEYQEDVANLERLRAEESQLRKDTRELGERGASPEEREAAAALEELAREERAIESASRALRENLRSLEKVAGDLDALVRSQERLVPEIRESSKAEGSSALADLLQRSRVLAQALARARALAEAKAAASAAVSRASRAESRAASGEISAEEAAREREAAAAQAREAAREAAREGRRGSEASSREAASSLEKVAQALASSGQGKEADGALEELAAIEREATERAKTAASGFEREAESNASGEASAKEAAEAAAQASAKAGEALEKGDAAAAEQAAREALEALERAGGGENDPSSLAREERRIGERAAEAAKALESASTSESSEQASDQARGASSSLARAARELESTDPAGAAPAAEEARERLRRARDAAERALEEERAEIRSREEPLAEREEALAERARTLAEAIGAREGLSPRQREGASRATGESSEAMEEGARATREGEEARASASRSAALDALARARRSLSDSRNVGGTAPEEAKELARRQQEIRERILELARRLKEKPNRPRPRSLDSAGASAQEAAESLDRGDLGEAEPKEEETEKYLAQARDEVEQERSRYLRLREEELLFKIGDELASMIKAHDEARARTAALDGERREAGDLTRAMKVGLRKTAETEKQVAEDCARVGKALAEEEAKVFAFLLGSNEEDLRAIAESLGAPEFATDERVQGLQEDVADRFARLREALKDEIRRRERPPGQGPQNTNEGSRPNRLVPDLAELKMLKQLEEEALGRTQAFGRRLEFLEGEEDSYTRQELTRLAHRHNRITELFQEFMLRLGHKPEEPEGADGKREEGSPPDGPPRRIR